MLFILIQIVRTHAKAKTQVTQGDNIVVDGWVVAFNPYPHPNSHLIPKHTHEYPKHLFFHFLTKTLRTNGQKASFRIACP